MAVTRLSPNGVMGRNYSFSPKEETVAMNAYMIGTVSIEPGMRGKVNIQHSMKGTSDIKTIMRFINPLTDLYVTLTGNQNPVDDSYFNSSSVSVTIEDPAGTVVLTTTPLTYVTSSNGDYQVTLDKSLLDGVLTRGRTYVVLIRSEDSGTGASRTWKMIATFEYDVQE